MMFWCSLPHVCPRNVTELPKLQLILLLRHDNNFLSSIALIPYIPILFLLIPANLNIRKEMTLLLLALIADEEAE